MSAFDILARPSPKLTKQEREQVKRIVWELLNTLKAERLVLLQVAQPRADPRCCLCGDAKSVGEPVAEIL